MIAASELGIHELPPDAKEVERDGKGRLLVAHSESGHHHYVASAEARFYGTSDPLVCYLKVDGEYADLEHAKPASAPDRHATQRIPRGLYRIHKQREYTPEGWRQVRD